MFRAAIGWVLLLVSLVGVVGQVSSWIFASILTCLTWLQLRRAAGGILLPISGVSALAAACLAADPDRGWVAIVPAVLPPLLVLRSRAGAAKGRAVWSGAIVLLSISPILSLIPGGASPANQVRLTPAEIQVMLADGDPAAMALVPQLDLKPTPALCQAARAYLLKVAREIRIEPPREPVPYTSQGEVAESVAGIRWFQAHGCDCGEGTAEMEAAVESYLDSPTRQKALASLADLRGK